MFDYRTSEEFPQGGSTCQKERCFSISLQKAIIYGKTRLFLLGEKGKELVAFLSGGEASEGGVEILIGHLFQKRSTILGEGRDEVDEIRIFAFL